jgi:predicted DNA-binding transcriptional regulator AlpA
MTSPLRSRREAAAFCHVSVDTFDAHVRPALPPPKKIGRRLFWLQSWLDQWAGVTAPAAAEPARQQGRAPSRDMRALAARLPLTARQRASLLGEDPPKR